ncbi:hypothetical protein GYMLUDRAFT_48790 [Collybiopsis luxurians FD-317 M1]|uniref:Uncharacterized protein n=1 Tax=Collybiopsis luxurians FD-317 M1 TaxID=944289 RepID=A0A0D0BXC2_9AGAR|nr:hypothetical protein GYMLUDRAFT_48790 [Collybiopsis luxurians FD-317 M1]
MRRAQSVRHRTRESLGNTSQFGTVGGAGSSQLALHADDLGVLREGDETDADVLRKQLLERDRECDRLKTNLSLLQSQLTVRPPVEHVQALEREYKDLELLLQGTQRENERCMAEMERMKIREKMLERELARLAGDNWQETLDLSPTPPANVGTLGRSSAWHQRSNTMSSMTSGSGPIVSSPTATTDQESASAESSNDSAALAAHIEKVRLLILGMETRMSKREDQLQEMVKRAEGEGRRWEELARV